MLKDMTPKQQAPDNQRANQGMIKHQNEKMTQIYMEQGEQRSPDLTRCTE